MGKQFCFTAVMKDEEKNAADKAREVVAQRGNEEVITAPKTK